MTSLLAASRKDFAATLGLHARTKPVRFGAAALPRLKCTLWQNNPPYPYWIRPANFPSFIPRQLLPPVLTANQDGLGVVFVKPDCLIPGSFPNLLVYLRGAHRVKKTAAMETATRSQQ